MTLPLRSMTGFGSSSVEKAGIRFQIQVKCVNQKSLRLNVKSRPNIGILEKKVRDIASKIIRRGSVDIFVEYSRIDINSDNIFNQKVVDTAVLSFQKIIDKHEIKNGIQLADLLSFPGIFDDSDISEFTSEEQDVLCQALAEALDQVVEMRDNEGSATASVLLEYVNEIAEFMTFARQRAPEVVNEYRQKLEVRMSDLKLENSPELDQQLIARELMLFADKADISEEVDRLENHILQFRNTVDCGGEAGKKLDFLAQEMLRETNTIASKANDRDISSSAINSKLAIEKIKEQAANIE
ncbi:MAG: YicC/YloC family endoribonuclease [Planctomycetota bacterium]|jgi:uncharacterized protein (TIGR00255 family)